MQKRIIITVDGLAGCGKSSLSKALAQKLGFAHLNSGLLYRGVALVALKFCANPLNDPELQEALEKHRLELRLNAAGAAVLFLDEKDVSANLQELRVSDITSQLASRDYVRRAVLPAQREAFGGSHLVAEGRDMGTVVFPDANLKFFVEVDEGVRAERRIKQLYGDLNKIAPVELNLLKEQMKLEITERDRRDTQRALSPTIAAPDAVFLDNNRAPFAAVVEKMYLEACQKGLLGM